MQTNKYTCTNYIPKQLKLPLKIEKIIAVTDPVYTFCETMDSIDLSRYFAAGKDCKKGRPRCDAIRLLKVILFAIMENGFCSLRKMEKLCRTDVRFMYLLDGMRPPSFATLGNFIRHSLMPVAEDIFRAINGYVLQKDDVDLRHAYIDGTKLEANANRYAWVWKKSCQTNRRRVFEKTSSLIDAMN